MESEFYVLENIVDYMEANGVNSALVEFSLDQNVVEEINRKHKVKLSIKDIEKSIDICLANEWLKHAYLGSGKYKGLRITTTGLGIIRSKKNAEQRRKSRTFLKKTSDFIEEHKGVVSLATALVAIVGLYLNYLRIK